MIKSKILLGITTFIMFASTGFALGAKGNFGSNNNRPNGYEHIDPSNAVPSKALSLGLEGYDSRKKWLGNLNYLTIIDYSQHSKNQRFYLIDMRSGQVTRQVVSHGSGSDSDNDGYAERFSNTSGSRATSLGFFATAYTYEGSNGYSLTLEGLSSSNSNAMDRAIVIHGANYVNSGSSKQGRSWGCPALSHSVSTSYINKIKNGSLVFAYHSNYY